MTQPSLWQTSAETGDFAELCNALYQREINLLAKGRFDTAIAVQTRLQSLPYYINRAAHSMNQVMVQGKSPLTLDIQNASWTAKQGSKPPLTGQETEQEHASVLAWYLQNNITVGLTVPVWLGNHIIVDCIDGIDVENKRLRTNVGGWFSLAPENVGKLDKVNKRLLKPNKKVMSSACAGHCWQGNTKHHPIMPSLRELLLSCSINWQNFKKPLAI